ncbi:hypothetical protein [Gluconobacter aidae]|uniref:Secreted protein n=1 Tax=Gluconobacter aidae TaxID=2662454 RepID=A0A7X1SSG4_9PROT|nr:hypothetical protein [Gluconobacter aidae]MQR99105.1 hypothetical protein [Gluconobacter aidae]
MIKRHSRPALLLALLPLAVALAAPVAARADDGDAKTNDDDPTINQQGFAINKILRVLQTNPDAASDSCINALKEMHQAQTALSKEEGVDAEHNQDIGVARDVLSSEMEDVTNMCGADARTYCRKSAAHPDPKLTAACNALPPEED